MNRILILKRGRCWCFYWFRERPDKYEPYAVNLIRVSPMGATATDAALMGDDLVERYSAKQYHFTESIHETVKQLTGYTMAPDVT